MEINRAVDSESFYIEYIHAFNGFLRLSKKEILVVAELLKENAKLNKESKDLLFETTIRKRIQSKLNMTVYNLNNYISSLKTKGILKEEHGILSINKKIIPEMVNGKATLKYNFIWRDTNK